MTTTLPDTTMLALREFLLAHLGLSYSKNHEKDLARKIEYAAKEFGHANPMRFVEWLLSNKLTDQQTGALASHLTIGETYFLREKKSFDFLEQIYLPGLVHKRLGTDKRLRVWCAGCATGEEAYSLAIVLLQSIPDISNWDVSILATDVNAMFLEKAKKGIFTKWSFRNNSEQFISKYFTKEAPNEFHIVPRVKSMVRFASLNLAEESYPSPSNNTQEIDIIFCCNVPIYFSPEGTRALTERLYGSLVKGGILVVSPVEMSGMISPSFSRINYAGYTIYQKGARRAEEMQPFIRQIPATRDTLTEPKPAERKPPSVFISDESELNRLKKLLPDKPTSQKVSPSDMAYEDAITLFKHNSSIDLVLMDIQMPYLNGYEATKELKKIRPHVPVIAQTAYAMDGEDEKCFAAGCDAYISNPIQPKDLLKEVTRFLSPAL